MPNEHLISYFLTKTYVVGTQKNSLNEMVLLSTQNIRLNIETVLLSPHNICLNWWVRKFLQFYPENLCLSKPVLFANVISR